MGAPEGYTTLQIHKTTLEEIRWVAAQLGMIGGRGKVVEDLIRWAMTPEGLSTIRAWRAQEIAAGGNFSCGKLP